jgi:hypothetical protein
MPRTREENRLYQRERRARQPDGGTNGGTNVAQLVTPAGSVAAAIRAEIGNLPDGGNGRPGLAATAVKLGELLDDPTATPQHPAAAGRLRELLAEMRQGQAATGAGKLAQLRAVRAARDTGETTADISGR